MNPRHFDATIHPFATRLAAEHTTLSRAWLARLDGLLDVDRRDLFPTHQQLDSQLDEELGTQGLGPGLSIVRECIQAMGGTVVVESVEGHGTGFVLTWPADAWDAPATPAGETGAT